MQKTTVLESLTPDRNLLKKTMLIMKLSAFFLIIGCLQASAKSIGQKVSLSVKNAPAAKVFRIIEKQTGYGFVCAKEQLSTMHPIDVTINNAELSIALEEVFSGQQYTYVISGNNIVVKERLNKKVVNTTVEVLDRIIIGRIVDEENHPLENATVIVKGTKIGTAADKDGRFSIKVPTGNNILEFSYVGYESAEINIGEKNSINITLKRKEGKSDEVVVAYGTQKRSSVTAAISQIKGSELTKQPVADISNSLGGRVSGILFTQGSGEPGSDGSNILIRGIGTTGNSQSLVIVDGVPRNYS